MSKKIKAANKEKNLQAKRARKSANRAKYAALMASGRNGKSYRAVKAGKKSRKKVGVDHPNGRCGNLACKKCFPVFHELMAERRALEAQYKWDHPTIKF
jgi:hypothetical protein